MSAAVLKFERPSRRPQTHIPVIAPQREEIDGSAQWTARCPNCGTLVVKQNRNASIAGQFQCWKNRCKTKFEV